jgi:hypothetical protein
MQKQIASIYFAEVKTDRALYGGHYRIPAVAKGGTPEFITVKDEIQRSQEPSPDGKSKYTRRDLIDGRHIAVDIVREWTQETPGMTPQCRPGIWVVRDEMPLLNPDGTPQFDADHNAQWRPATTEEKEQMFQEDLASNRNADANWAEFLIQQGDFLDGQEPSHRKFIGPLAKQAARHWGREREWLEELRDSDIKKCPYCSKSIAKVAVKCSCGEIVDLEGYARLKQREKEVLEAAGKGVVRPPVSNSGKPAAA